MEERGRSSLNLGVAPPPKPPPPRRKSSHRQRESDPPYMPRCSYPLSTPSASGRDSPPSHRAGERSDTEPSCTATSHHLAPSAHARRQEIEIGGARDRVLQFRVRLSSFFVGAATTLPVGFYFLYKDYMLAHEAISNKGEALVQTHENLEHLATMERVLGTIPEHMIRRTNYLSMSSCQCEKGECRPLQKEEWSEELSPYGNRFIDALFEEDAFGIVTISLEEGDEADIQWQKRLHLHVTWISG